MGFELQVVRNNPLSGDDDLGRVLMQFLKNIGYLPQNAGEDAGFRLMRDCFLRHSEKPWTIDELLTELDTNKSTLYRYLNKLKGLDILDEIEIPAEKPQEDEAYKKIKKGYRFRFSSFKTAWGIVESHTSVALDNYRKTVDHLDDLAGTIDIKSEKPQELRNPALTVDGIILRNQNREILLIRRKNEPYKDMWALPGGFVDLGEEVETAIIREILEETNLECRIKKLASIASRPDRDPRGHTVSIVYLLDQENPEEKPESGDDAGEVSWHILTDLPDLAFDHSEIIKNVIERKII
jgi:8-oxo-dGTP diphosphatase